MGIDMTRDRVNMKVRKFVYKVKRKAIREKKTRKEKKKKHQARFVDPKGIPIF